MVSMFFLIWIRIFYRDNLIALSVAAFTFFLVQVSTKITTMTFVWIQISFKARKKIGIRNVKHVRRKMEVSQLMLPGTVVVAINTIFQPLYASIKYVCCERNL